MDKGCPWCQGRRRVPLTRCVGHLVDARTVRLLDLLVAYHEHGVLPVAGGMVDQARTFTQALGVFEAEWASCESRAVERARAKATTPTQDPRRRG